MDINDIKIGDIFLIHVLLTGEKANPPIVARVRNIKYDVVLSDYVIYWEMISDGYQYYNWRKKKVRYWGQNYLFSTFKKCCEPVESIDEALVYLL